MGDKFLAVMGLVACLAVWAGMAAGATRRQRWQAQGALLWRALAQGLRQSRQRLRHPAQARQARREAADAIERARRAAQVDRDGNVYRPDAFKQRPRRDKLH